MQLTTFRIYRSSHPNRYYHSDTLIQFLFGGPSNALPNTVETPHVAYWRDKREVDDLSPTSTLESNYSRGLWSHGLILCVSNYSGMALPFPGSFTVTFKGKEVLASPILG